MSRLKVNHQKRIMAAIDKGALTYTAIGEVLGLTRQAVHQYCQKHPKLIDYLYAKIQELDDKRKTKLENKAFELAAAGEVQLIKFLLERKYGYKNNLDVTSNNDNINNVKIEIVNNNGN